MKTPFTEFMTILVVTVALLSLTGCATRIGPGHVGLEIALAGTQRGVQDIPVKTGWLFYNPVTTSVLEYPTFVQTAKWSDDESENGGPNEELTFKSKEGVELRADVSLSYYLTPDKVPHFYVKYRSDNLTHFTHGMLRNVARDAFNEVAATYSVDDINGPKLGQFLAEVKAKVNQQVSPEGVVIDQFGLLETIRLPDSYRQAMLAKQTAVQLAQQKENELRATKAEVEKQVAAAEGNAKARIAEAEGEAKANNILTNSITDRVLTMRRLDIQRAAVDKWDGSVPKIQGGTGGSAGSSLNIIVPIKE